MASFFVVSTVRLLQAADSFSENNKMKEEGRKERKQRKILIEKLGCGVPGSNWRPPDYETDALTN